MVAQKSVLVSDRTTGPETVDNSDGADAGHAVDQPLLARVPEWVVTFGAGSLLTSTLLTLAAAAFAGHAVATGRPYLELEPYQLGLATLQFSGATVFQAAGVYFARKRIRWLVVMLATAAGILSIIGLPFAFVACVCLGLGKYHFALDTPAERLRAGGDENEDVDVDE